MYRKELVTAFSGSLRTMLSIHITVINIPGNVSMALCPILADTTDVPAGLAADSSLQRATCPCYILLDNASLWTGRTWLFQRSEHSEEHHTKDVANTCSTMFFSKVDLLFAEHTAWF